MSPLTHFRNYPESRTFTPPQWSRTHLRFKICTTSLIIICVPAVANAQYKTTESCAATSVGEYTACVGVVASTSGISTLDAPTAGYFATEGTASALSAENTGAYGPGLYASSNGSYAVQGEGAGIGVFGAANYPSANLITSGVNAGVAGVGSGSGIYGVYGQSVNSNGVNGSSTSDNAIYGSTSATSGSKAGVKGITSETTGYGVYGENNASSGNSVGVYGSSSTGYGVYGYSTGSTEGAGDGVYGSSYYGNGVYGTSHEGYAGYFSGILYGTTIQCGTGCTSDARLKHNIQPLTGSLDRMLQLKGETFEWNNPEKHQNHTGTQTGVIAQEVEKFFPQWVHDDPETHFKVVEPDERTVLGLTVESFRTLKNENDELRARVNRLENGQHPIAASFTSGLGISPGNLGLALLTLVGAFAISRRKQDRTA